MSESNSLVKLFNDIMKGMDDDDEKKLQQFTPDGVPAMIARPPMPEEVTPRVKENQTVRQKQEEYYLDTLDGSDPRQLRSANSIRAEITGPNNNNRVVPAPQQPVGPIEQPVRPIEQPVSSIEPPELLRRIPQYESRLDDPQAGIVQPDGRMGTHQMAAEVDPETGMMTAFPMITEMPDGTLKQFENKDEALAYNKSVNNVKAFSDPQEGIDYAKGGYKEGTALAPTDQQKFSEQFGDVPLMGEVPKVEQVSEVENRITKYLESDEGKGVFPNAPEERRRGFVEKKVLKEMEGERERLSKTAPVSEQERAEWRLSNPQLFPGAEPEAIDKIIQEEKYGTKRDDKYFNTKVKPLELTEDGVPSLIARPPNGEKVEQEVVSSNQAVVDPNNQDAKSSVDAEVDRLLEEGLPRGMMGDDGSLEFEPVDPDKLDPSGDPVKVEDPKQGFLSTLWDGIKDVIVSQVKDPANQKALFAYAVSRALGYDGVTLASQVLSNEWKVGEATAKHERELEKLYGKENLAALKKQQENLTIDYSKPVTVFNPDTQENYTVFMTKDKQGFVFDDGGTEPFTVSTLLQGGYSIGEGLDFADQQQLLSDLMEKDAKTYAATITDNFLNPDLEGKERDNVKKALALASEPPVIRAAMTAFTNKYGRGTDFTTAEVKTIASNGINNYLRAVADGRAKGSKDLIGYMDYEQIKYDITDNGIPSSFFTISGEEDQEIGVNGWSRTNNVVNKVTNNINSRLGKGSYTNTDIYKVLADEFNKKQGDKEFMTFWSKASNNSAEDKEEALSPAMLWVQSITRQDVSPSYKAPSLTEVLDMLAKRKG